MQNTCARICKPATSGKPLKNIPRKLQPWCAVFDYAVSVFRNRIGGGQGCLLGELHAVSRPMIHARLTNCILTKGKIPVISYLRYAAALMWFAAVPTSAAYEDQFLDASGVKIRYIDSGKGETIVLLHGGTSNLESWTSRGVVANLEKDFRVIAFDARGHGKSDKPREPAAYGRQQALDVVRILDALKIERAHIVGFSLGGSTVAQLLTLHPERFLTAVQVASAGRSPKEANNPRIEIEAAEIARDCISRSRVMRQAPAGMKSTEEEIQKRIEECRANKLFDQHSTAASLRGYRDQAVTTEQMAAVKVPTLGIVGTLDHTLKAMQALKTVRPDMKLVLLEGVSHTGATGIQGRPELIAEIRSFIAEQHTSAAKNR
jgi:pimeloyl-ACP methyl ester carboxylesterase